jgi:hypothetical protein
MLQYRGGEWACQWQGSGEVLVTSFNYSVGYNPQRRGKSQVALKAKDRQKLYL